MRFEGGDGDGVDLVGFMILRDLDGAHLFGDRWGRHCCCWFMSLVGVVELFLEW